MKRIQYILLGLAILVVVFMATGCSGPVDIEEQFDQRAEELGAGAPVSPVFQDSLVQVETCDPTPGQRFYIPQDDKGHGYAVGETAAVVFFPGMGVMVLHEVNGEWFSVATPYTSEEEGEYVTCIVVEEETITIGISLTDGVWFETDADVRIWDTDEVLPGLPPGSPPPSGINA
ncbi:MAG TPA: hypothetical protein PKL83_00710 [bacterium]|nr:hypothetical protein [bacterium]